MELVYDVKKHERAFAVTVVSEKFDGHETIQESQRSLLELKELLRTLEVDCIGDATQNKKKIESATILGRGKLEEIANEAKSENADFLVFDFELTASQMRNISKITGFKVFDRCQVILQIFSLHARSNEARIQIEISKLKYLLPRLTSLWTHFSKQKGGIGLKGEGEQQLELDRRIVRKKILAYEKQLKGLKVSRKERRKKRENSTLTAALVGYTNAGKSSILNRLCKVDTISENKLFATVDSTFRTLTPDTKPPLILIDTVGFLSNLPNTLIEGFKTTLESIDEADLLLIVVDISDPHLEKHIETTNQVLDELDLGKKERIYIFNKKDQAENLLKAKVKIRKYPNSHIISAMDDSDVLNLRKEIIDYFLDKQIHQDLFVPYAKGNVHSKIEKFTNIEKRTNHENGIYYRIRTPDHLFQKIGIKDFALSPEDKEKLFT